MKTTEKAFETIVVEHPEPRIARIVMNRPEARNAQNLQMTYDLNAAFDQAVQDDAVKVIILAGSGPHEAPGIPEEMLPVVPEYLNSRAYTIFGGSSEIQREIVAKMVLGL